MTRASTAQSEELFTPPCSAHMRSTFVGEEEKGDHLDRHRHEREGSDLSTVGSLIDVVLPWVGAGRYHDGEMTAPALSGRLRSSEHGLPVSARARSSRGGRHSISSIESYMSDSSIDAALSTMRMTASSSSHRDPETEGGHGASLRRSMSTGASGRSRGSYTAAGRSRLAKGSEEDLLALDPDMNSFLPTTKSFQHSDIIDARKALGREDDADMGVDAYYYTRRSSSTQRSVASGQPSLNRHKARTPSVASHPGSAGSGIPDDQFAVKIIYPSSTDCSAIILRVPRTVTFEEFQVKLHLKFHEAEGIDLSMLQKGFRIGHRFTLPAPANRSSLESDTESARVGRARSFSVSSLGGMVDPALLMIIKNQYDWELAVPQGKEKLILQVIVDH